LITAGDHAVDGERPGTDDTAVGLEGEHQRFAGGVDDNGRTEAFEFKPDTVAGVSAMRLNGLNWLSRELNR
jgi:hypothetical protein